MCRNDLALAKVLEQLLGFQIVQALATAGADSCLNLKKEHIVATADDLFNLLYNQFTAAHGANRHNVWHIYRLLNRKSIHRDGSGT